jgi:hypothetical protein
VGQLTDELEKRFFREIEGIPWILEVHAGRVTSGEDVSVEELIQGLTIAVIALHENLLWLAKHVEQEEGH